MIYNIITQLYIAPVGEQLEYNIHSSELFSGELSVIDGKTNSIAKDIAIAFPYQNIVVNPATNMVYDFRPGGYIIVIDGKTNGVVYDIYNANLLFEDTIDATINPENQYNLRNYTFS